jgi:hypothetical protein
MKRTSKTLAFLLTTLSIAVISIAGCATTGMDGDNLKYAIKDLEMAIEQARAEMTQGGR